MRSGSGGWSANSVATKLRPSDGEARSDDLLRFISVVVVSDGC